MEKTKGLEKLQWDGEIASLLEVFQLLALFLLNII